MILAVVFYFAAVTTVLLLWLLPHRRTQVTGWAQRLAAHGAGTGRRAAVSGGRGVARLARTADAGSAAARAWLAVHRREALVTGMVLVAAPLLPVALRPWFRLEDEERRASRAVNEQVAALLHGEHLAPPAALPPELFTTPEVEQARPSARGASREWALLDADFRQRLLLVFKLMRERHGYDMVLLEGYRSPERQARLAALGSQVTRAGAFESWHQYGLAADCAFLRGGRVVVPERDAWAAVGYELYGEAARSVGLTWGGGWRELKDLGHVELRRPGVMRRRPEVDHIAAASER